MTNTTDKSELTATDLRLALNEIYPDSTYGAVPVIDQHDALEAFRAFDDGALAEVPHALDAYVSHHRLSAV